MNGEREAIERGKRRDRKVREAVELLDAGVERILDGEQFKRYLSFAAKFHRYSANNCLLVMLQKPGATRVAGYKRWQELGRQVRRGEEGIRIFAPIFRTVEDEESGERRLVLPGGYAGARAEDGGVVVGQLPAPASRFEQLELYMIHAAEDACEGRRSR